jgi:hypothetical protein
MNPVDIEVPRDRNVSFGPLLIPTHDRRFTGFDDRINERPRKTLNCEAPAERLRKLLHPLVEFRLTDRTSHSADHGKCRQCASI